MQLLLAPVKFNTLIGNFLNRNLINDFDVFIAITGLHEINQ